ncbi:hypothetical protein D3C71_175450 [compost metagenome]
MPAPHTISAQDILTGGPIESLIASSSGGSSRARKRFSVVSDIESGLISFRVEAHGRISGFALADLDKAVEAYNEG